MNVDINEGLKFIEKIDDLSALPSIAMDIMGMLNDPSSSVKEIVSKISLDQAMVSYVMKNCNSALYGVRTEVTSVNRAINLLGFSNLKSILMAYFMRNLYRLSGKNPIKESLWKHSIAVAVFCRDMAGVVPKLKMDAEEAYLVGLLHDVGKIVLYLDDSSAYEEIVRIVSEGKEDFFNAEKARLRFTHVDVGYFLLTKWHFSPDLIEVVYHHHDNEYSLGAQRKPPITLVAFADSLSHIYLENRFDELKPYLDLFNMTGKELDGMIKRSLQDIEKFFEIL